MKIHVIKPDQRRPSHATGEIVWATVGNYLENRDCEPKTRPAIIVRAGSCQHWIVGLTTRAHFKTTTANRVPINLTNATGLCGRSYLWSSRVSRLCRLDVRTHAGWIDELALATLVRHVPMPPSMVHELRIIARSTKSQGEIIPSTYTESAHHDAIVATTLLTLVRTRPR